MQPASSSPMSVSGNNVALLSPRAGTFWKPGHETHTSQRHGIRVHYLCSLEHLRDRASDDSGCVIARGQAALHFQGFAEAAGPADRSPGEREGGGAGGGGGCWAGQDVSMRCLRRFTLTSPHELSPSFQTAASARPPTAPLASHSPARAAPQPPPPPRIHPWPLPRPHLPNGLAASPPPSRTPSHGPQTHPGKHEAPLLLFTSQTFAFLGCNSVCPVAPPQPLPAPGPSSTPEALSWGCWFPWPVRAPPPAGGL